MSQNWLFLGMSLKTGQWLRSLLLGTSMCCMVGVSLADEWGSLYIPSFTRLHFRVDNSNHVLKGQVVPVIREGEGISSHNESEAQINAYLSSQNCQLVMDLSTIKVNNRRQAKDIRLLCPGRKTELNGYVVDASGNRGIETVRAGEWAYVVIKQNATLE